MTRPKSAEPWTEARIRAQGIRMDGRLAVEAIYGYGESKAYELLAAGDVDFPVIRRGRRYIVPTAAVIELLRCPEQTDSSKADAPETTALRLVRAG